MRHKWSWKPVVVGAILFGVLMCLFTGWLVAALDCPGLKWGCLSHRSLATDLISFGFPSLLIGGMIGAGLGALFTLARNMMQKKG
jgi:hypothetical protein